MDTLSVKRYQKAFEQGRQDVLTGNQSLSLAEDPKEYEFYIRGRLDAGEKKQVPNQSINYTSKGYATQTASTEEVEPLKTILF